MKNNFTLEEWFKISFRIMKSNWIEWLTITGLMTIILLGIFFFLFQEMELLILEYIKVPKDWEIFIFSIAKRAGLFLFGIILFFNFADLFIIHTTSQWYSGKRLAIEETLLKALSALPLSILFSAAYSIMAFVAAMFCFFPVIFVVVFFLFIFQALIIEDRGLGSFERSIELVKQNFGLFLVLPFLISFAFQFIDTIPFYVIQFQFENFILPDWLKKMEPQEMVDFFLKSPYTFLFLGIIIFIFSVQANLKSILYTIAFEIARTETLGKKEIE